MNTTRLPHNLPLLCSFYRGNDVQEGDIKALLVDAVLTLQAPEGAEDEVQRRRIKVAY